VVGAAALGLLLGIPIYVIIGKLFNDDSGAILFVWEAFAATLAAFIAWRKTPFGGYCNFVGRDGCAQFSFRGKRENITEKRVFLFKDASGVWKTMTHRYKAGAYQCTTYSFFWYRPASGSKEYAFKLQDLYICDPNKPLPQTEKLDNIHFALAVEDAWYDYLLPKAQEELDQKKCLTFAEARHGLVHLGHGFLELVDKQGYASRCEASQIGSVIASRGNETLTLNPKVAGSAFFPSGKAVSVNYSGMLNNRLFFSAFEKLLDIKIEWR
jgi:hypothetical protein